MYETLLKPQDTTCKDSYTDSFVSELQTEIILYLLIRVLYSLPGM